MLCFSKSPVARLSEVPSFMGLRAFALAGYTGNHLAIDPDLGVFDLFLGNRCHNRVSLVQPEEAAVSLGLSDQGDGQVLWPDGRPAASSFRYVYKGQPAAYGEGMPEEARLAAGTPAELKLLTGRHLSLMDVSPIIMYNI